VNLPWRNLLLTALVALAAGFAGVQIGARFLPDSVQQGPKPLRQTVFAVIQGFTLNPEQESFVSQIEDDYLRHSAEIRSRIRTANGKLASAMVRDMGFGKETEEATENIRQGVGELQKETIIYTLSVRSVLQPDQQKIFDEKITHALTYEPP
jgi:hypothetical protein